jgi:hypothetical protein
MSLTRMEKECGRHEDILRQEISDLHMVGSQDETNEELCHKMLYFYNFEKNGEKRKF